MAKGKGSLIDKFRHRRTLSRWSIAAEKAQGAELSDLQQTRSAARQLRNVLNNLIHVADTRLALPRIGSNTFPRPKGTLWSWRPALWRGPLMQPGVAGAKSKAALGAEVALFHDCKDSELIARQLRNTKETDLAPFALKLDVMHFEGSFLSLVVNFPETAVEDLNRRQILRLSTVIETERPIEIFARLNIKHGPNTEQMVQEIPKNLDHQTLEFDLAYADINERRLESIWLDLIFENPAMNQVVIRDINFSRYPRAEL